MVGQYSSSDSLQVGGPRLMFKSSNSSLCVQSLPAQVILYTPPDARRLRFLTLSDTQRVQRTTTYEPMYQDALFMDDESQEVSKGLVEILPLVNIECHTLRGLLS